MKYAYRGIFAIIFLLSTIAALEWSGNDIAFRVACILALMTMSAMATIAMALIISFPVGVLWVIVKAWQLLRKGSK